jgi:hypothetical protein
MKFQRIAVPANGDVVLPVEAGQVVCPRQGIVDLERCWACPDYEGLSGDRSEGVVCNANLEDVAVDFRPTVH